MRGEDTEAHKRRQRQIMLPQAKELQEPQELEEEQAGSPPVPPETVRLCLDLGLRVSRAERTFLLCKLQVCGNL